MTIAIIGAGIAGLTAAYTLVQAGMNDVVLFEKSPVVAGRVATRWFDLPRGRAFVDYGVQYFRTESPTFSRLILEKLPRDTLVDVTHPVWVFDRAGTLSPGDAATNTQEKWTYREGAAVLGELITESAHLRIHTQTSIGMLQWKQGRYALIDEDGGALGDYDAVIVAVPSTQAADLIALSAIPNLEKITLEGSLRQAVYRRCITITLGFLRPLQARPYYALVNPTRDHPISWIGFEHHKPGHLPDDCAAVVIQMGGDYSLSHWDWGNFELLATITAQASELLGEDLRESDFVDVHKWKLSQPDRLASESAVNGVLPSLWFAGDYLRGGRVHLAAETGAAAAESLLIGSR
ncbi:Renalase [Anaerolineae bacterium]|nr:Renalase [Anaerolineae bacterium]